MSKHHDRQFLILAAIFCILVWIYLLVDTVRMEERALMSRDVVLDCTGQPVLTHERVWELGRGYREPTEEERAFEGRRP